MRVVERDERHSRRAPAADQCGLHEVGTSGDGREVTANAEGPLRHRLKAPALGQTPEPGRLVSGEAAGRPHHMVSGVDRAYHERRTFSGAGERIGGLLHGRVGHRLPHPGHERLPRVLVVGERMRLPGVAIERERTVSDEPAVVRLEGATVELVQIHAHGAGAAKAARRIAAMPSMPARSPSASRTSSRTTSGCENRSADVTSTLTAAGTLSSAPTPWCARREPRAPTAHRARRSRRRR